MNILIDFSQIPILKKGVGIYGLNLVKNLKTDSTFHFFVLVQDDDNSLNDCDKNSITLIRVNSKKFRNLFNRFLLEQFYIPFLIKQYKIDVIHSLHYSFPIFTRARKVVTVCDMIFLKYPELHLKSKVLYFQCFIWLTTLFADKVICISKSTERDYLLYFNCLSHFTSVVELGKDEKYKPDLSSSAIMSTLLKFGIVGEYILFIGTLEPRKNITRLIRAFSKLIGDGCNLNLVIVGNKGWYYEPIFLLVKQLQLETKVIFTGFIEEYEKPALLVGAKIFAYPSLYEGFGIPVLEALACGVPTLTSNISSMPEVAGDAAVLVDPYSVEDIYASLTKLYNDEPLCKELRKRGLIQAGKFSWQMTAEKTIGVYKSFLRTSA